LYVEIKDIFLHTAVAVCVYLTRCMAETSLSHSFPRYYGLWATCVHVYVFIMSFL